MTKPPKTLTDYYQGFRVYYGAILEIGEKGLHYDNGVKINGSNLLRLRPIITNLNLGFLVYCGTIFDSEKKTVCFTIMT